MSDNDLDLGIAKLLAEDRAEKAMQHGPAALDLIDHYRDRLNEWVNNGDLTVQQAWLVLGRALQELGWRHYPENGLATLSCGHVCSLDVG